jgi:pimeloyl-ACP methyl ester carboxylesterase
MTIALVHGVPETAAVWDLLVDELVALGYDEPLRLSPPGFGAPAPDGWAATVHAYAAWLVGELENIGHPVDLVGHDWGGGHVLNVAMARPDLIRTWVTDVAGVFDEDYVWEGLAAQWQTPGLSEQVIAAMTAQPPEEGAAFLAGAGMHPVIAERVAPDIDEAMGACILGLYRSAVQPVVAEVGKRLEAAAARPGLAILPTEDHGVGTDAQRRRTAARAGGACRGLVGTRPLVDDRRSASRSVAAQFVLVVGAEGTET